MATNFSKIINKDIYIIWKKISEIDKKIYTGRNFALNVSCFEKFIIELYYQCYVSDFHERNFSMRVTNKRFKIIFLRILNKNQNIFKKKTFNFLNWYKCIQYK